MLMLIAKVTVSKRLVELLGLVWFVVEIHLCCELHLCCCIYVCLLECNCIFHVTCILYLCCSFTKKTNEKIISKAHLLGLFILR